MSQWYDVVNAVGGSNMVGNIANIVFTNRAQEQRAKEFDAQQQQLSIDNAYRNKALAADTAFKDRVASQDDVKLKQAQQHLDQMYEIQLGQNKIGEKNANANMVNANANASNVRLTHKREMKGLGLREDAQKFEQQNIALDRNSYYVGNTLNTITAKAKKKGHIFRDGSLDWEKITDDPEYDASLNAMKTFTAADPRIRDAVEQKYPGVIPKTEDGRSFGISFVSDPNDPKVERLAFVDPDTKEFTLLEGEDKVLFKTEVYQQLEEFARAFSGKKGTEQIYQENGGSSADKKQAYLDKQQADTLEKLGLPPATRGYREDPGVYSSANMQNYFQQTGLDLKGNQLTRGTGTATTPGQQDPGATPMAGSATPGYGQKANLDYSKLADEGQRLAAEEAAQAADEQIAKNLFVRGGGAGLIGRSAERYKGNPTPFWQDEGDMIDDVGKFVSTHPDVTAKILGKESVEPFFEKMPYGDQIKVVEAVANLRRKQSEKADFGSGWTGVVTGLFGEELQEWTSEGVMPRENGDLLGVKNVGDGISYNDAMSTLDAAARYATNSVSAGVDTLGKFGSAAGLRLEDAIRSSNMRLPQATPGGFSLIQWNEDRKRRIAEQLAARQAQR